MLDQNNFYMLEIRSDNHCFVKDLTCSDIPSIHIWLPILHSTGDIQQNQTKKKQGKIILTWVSEKNIILMAEYTGRYGGK